MEGNLLNNKSILTFLKNSIWLVLKRSVSYVLLVLLLDMNL